MTAHIPPQLDVLAEVLAVVPLLFLKSLSHPKFFLSQALTEGRDRAHRNSWPDNMIARHAEAEVGAAAAPLRAQQR